MGVRMGRVGSQGREQSRCPECGQRVAGQVGSTVRDFERVVGCWLDSEVPGRRKGVSEGEKGGER